MSVAKYAIGAFAAIIAFALPVHANENLYRKVVQATAYISKSEGAQVTGSGTGFLIDEKERLMITARHVVETKKGIADVVAVVFAQEVDGEIMTDWDYYRKNWNTLVIRGKVVYESVRRDMAILQLDKVPQGRKPLELAAKKASPGQKIHVVGNSSVISGGTFNYCQGFVRNTFRYIGSGANVVATQAPTNKGDSGGPVVNDLGEVVGFCSLGTREGEQAADLSICVTEIRMGLQEMRGQLAGRSPLDPDRTRSFKGSAKSAVQMAYMEKNATYRIAVKGQGFTPDLRVEEPEPKFVDKKNPPPAPYPFTNSAYGINNDVQMIFTAKETGDHRITIAFGPSTDVGKGPFRYTYNIEQIDFETDTVLKEPEFKLNEHVKKLEAGKLYDITVKAKGFEPDVRVLDGTKVVANQANGGAKTKFGSGAEFVTKLRYVAVKTAEHRVLVYPSTFSPAKATSQPYSVEITEGKPALYLVDRLTEKDSLYPNGGPFKVHTVKLEANKFYQIDLITTAFDSRVLLEDSNGKVVSQGFDFGESSARLVFAPTQTGMFRIIATSHQVNASGPYTLVVIESANAPYMPSTVTPKGK